MALRRGARCRAGPRPGEDLCHRRRRGGAGRSARPASYSDAADWRTCRTACAPAISRPPPTARHAFRKDLRRSVIFGRNDLVQDAPISRIDLLVCRNALMYLNAETQASVLSRFHFAIKPGRCHLPRQGRDAAHPLPPLHPDRPQAAGLPAGPARRRHRPPPCRRRPSRVRRSARPNGPSSRHSLLTRQPRPRSWSTPICC